MNLPRALDEYGLHVRRRIRGDAGRLAGTAQAALREYLTDYCGLEDTAALTPGDLFAFLLDYYPAEEEPDPVGALALLDAAAGFSRWLLERDEVQTASFAAAEERLREDLSRVLAARALLHAHARRDDIAAEVPVEDAAEGTELGTLGTGLTRVARLDEVDYPAAEEDRYRVVAVEPGQVTLHAATREALGEGPVGPVLLPAGAAERLRPGDIIHAEIAPGPAGWELLEVLGIRPGGYP